MKNYLMNSVFISVLLLFVSWIGYAQIPKDTLQIEFESKGTSVGIKEIYYKEHDLNDAPQIFISFTPVGIWSCSDDVGVGPLLGGNYRPIEQFEIASDIMVPFFHRGAATSAKGPYKKRFFAINITPTFYFFTKRTTKKSRFKLTGSWSYGYNSYTKHVLVMDLPKQRNHQLGFRPGYLYMQGIRRAGYQYDDLSFQSNIITAGLVYRRTTHHVFGIKGSGYRIVSRDMSFFADFMYDVKTNIYDFNTGRVKFPKKINNILGGKVGFEYRLGVSESKPLYAKIKVEGGYAPSYVNNFYFQFGIYFGIGVDKFYRNNYK